jgi:hypothetical protein
MMKEAETSLGALLIGPSPERWGEEVAEEVDSKGVLEELSKRIGGKTEFTTWPSALRAIMEKIPDVLGIEIGEILANGWKKAEELHGYANRTEYPPEETILVELATHEIRSSHEPHLEVMINDISVGRVDFEVDLVLEVEAALLTVRDGRIWKAAAGRCSASGELKCEGHRIVKRESEKVVLPGEIKFDPPIELERKTDVHPQTEG